VQDSHRLIYKQNTTLQYSKRITYRKKFDSKTKDLVLVGYEFGCHSYRLWEPGTKSVSVVRDVKMFEPIRKPQTVGDSVDAMSQMNMLFPTEEVIANHTRSKVNLGDDAISDENAAKLIECLSVGVRQFDIDDPKNYKQAVDCDNSSDWKQAMNSEISSLQKCKTWNLVPRCEVEGTLLKSMWVFKTKVTPGTNETRCKARLVVKGCSQRAGVDYSETFSPVARFETIRTVLSFASSANCQLYTFDVKTAFLNGDLEGEKNFYGATGRVFRRNYSCM
jgi:hypothetical protein